METKDQNTGSGRRQGLIIYAIYVVALIASVLLIGKIVYLELFFKPEPKIVSALTPRNIRRTIDPVRGNILDCNGKILAMSYPMYVLHMDCSVWEDEKWMPRARNLADSLPAILPGKNADHYFRMFTNARKRGERYLSLGEPVDRKTLKRIQSLPLFREGRNKGGLIVELKNTRKYPYGQIARRVIGFVRDNKVAAGKNYIGIEGRYNGELHGKDGTEWLRETEKRNVVRNTDSLFTPAVNGRDIRLTIDIDIQEAADIALRRQLESETEIEGAYLMLMDVETGAIKAMVNLYRNPRTGKYEESMNLAIGRRGEPGSVFKTVTLVSVLSDGYIKSLAQRIPTNHGIVKDTRCRQDHHIADWERDHHTSSISIIDGFKISSNYVFATLAVKNYARDPMRYIDKLYSYGLGDAFKFDIDGLLKPYIPSPKTVSYWTNTDLGNMGFGYNTLLTPLHILTFYNALAAGGRMMKPYLVEGPSILNESICSKAVADTVRRALMAVTEEGTARCLKNAPVKVAGKTGTSFGTFPKEQKGRTPYEDKEGRRKYQGTFAGYFPAEDPKYSIISGVYSLPTKKSYQGAGIPAHAIKEVVEYLEKNDPSRQDVIRK